MIEVIRKTDTPMCTFTLYTDDEKEMVHCFFKYDTHPVNKKFYKMSGQPKEEYVRETP